MKVVKSSLVPPLRFKRAADEDEHSEIIAVSIYKAPKSKQEIMDGHYDTTQHDASHQKKHRKDTVQLNEECSDFKH